MNEAVENSVEKYMDVLTRIDNHIENLEADENDSSKEQVDDLQAIRNELISHVKENGINQEIIDKSNRLISVFN
jgi:molecular chaperone GrpE (heat shock protein)